MRQVLIKNGVAAGVILENGDELMANTVISNLDPNRTYLKMVGADNLEADVLKEINRFKLRGSSGKVNLALDSVPKFHFERMI